MLKAMEEAKEHIHMQFYIYRDDEIGEQFQDVMIRKARQGVKVRLLCDGLGSHRLSRRFIRTLRNAGVEFHFFYLRLVLYWIVGLISAIIGRS